MTLEELNSIICEIIIPQEKPRSSQNSHRRKQWENRRNWHRCTIGESCKIGQIKACLIAKQKPFKRNRTKNPLCNDCFGRYGLHSPGFMGGVFYYCDSDTHFKKFSYNCKILRKYLNRYIRRYKGEIGNYSCYKKMFEYAWVCV